MKSGRSSGPSRDAHNTRALYDQDTHCIHFVIVFVDAAAFSFQRFGRFVFSTLFFFTTIFRHNTRSHSPTWALFVRGTHRRNTHTHIARGGRGRQPERIRSSDLSRRERARPSCSVRSSPRRSLYVSYAHYSPSVVFPVENFVVFFQYFPNRRESETARKSRTDRRGLERHCRNGCRRGTRVHRRRSVYTVRASRKQIRKDAREVFLKTRTRYTKGDTAVGNVGHARRGVLVLVAAHLRPFTAANAFLRSDRTAATTAQQQQLALVVCA